MKGFSLKQLGINQFMVAEKNTTHNNGALSTSQLSFVGSLKDVAEKLMLHGVELREIEVALEQFDDHGHNLAHFGHFGGFIYSEFEGVNH